MKARINANCKAKMEAIKTRIDTNNATAKTPVRRNSITMEGGQNFPPKADQPQAETEKTQKEKTRLSRRSPAFRGINSATLRGMVAND